MSDSEGGPKQVDDLNYHSVNHTVVQTCGWTKNALRGRGRCYKNILMFSLREFPTLFYSNY